MKQEELRKLITEAKETLVYNKTDFGEFGSVIKLAYAINILDNLENKLHYSDLIQVCGCERPARKTMCQLPKGHSGSHQAVVFWEDE